MAKRFVLRTETFGTTLFDKKLLRHKFVRHDEIPTELYFDDVVVEDYEMRESDLTNARTDILYTPIRVYFDLTFACNLRCRTCYNQSGKASPDELTNEQTKKALSGLRRDNVLDVRFSGGEITQRHDWFDILSEAKKLGFAVSMNTNGVYDDNSIIPKMAELDLEQITFSVDGDRELHDYIRGSGNYDRVVDSMSKLHKLGATLRINTIISKNSINSIENMLELASNYADEINFFFFRPIGRARGLMHVIATYEDLQRFNEKLERLKPEYSHINILHKEKVIETNSISNNVHNHVGLYVGATDGFTRFNILQNGDLCAGGYASYIDKDLVLGNIVTEGYTLINVWQNSEKLNAFREKSKRLVERCNNCEERAERCGGEGIEMLLYREATGERNPYCKYEVTNNE